MREPGINDVRRILWEEWDPVGLHASDGPTDEYDSYAARITKMLNEGRDEYFIANYLSQLATVAMGLSSSDRKNNQRVANLLISVRK